MFTPEEFADSCDQAIKDLAAMSAQLKKGDLAGVALGQTALEINLRALRTRCVDHTIADPKLEQLGEQLIEALVEQDRSADVADREFQESLDRTITELIRKIAGHPARTLEGLRVKARALRWVQRRNVVEFAGSAEFEKLETELSSEIADELLRLGMK